MARVSTFLNFEQETEEAFNFYKSVFGGEFEGGIGRFSEMPPEEGQPQLSEEDKNLVMHVSLPIINGHRLMGADAPKSRGFKLVKGNNMYITLEPDTRSEADRLFKALSAGGQVEVELQEMFWGDYFATWTDKFGVNWMIDCESKN